MPEITWGYLKDWAAQNGIQDDYAVITPDGDPVRDLDAQHEQGEQALVLDFDPAF